MINSRPEATRQAWRSQKNSDYVAFYKAATDEARRIDNTPEDLEHSHPGSVHFSEDSKFPGAQVFGLDDNSPDVALYSQEVSRKPKSDESYATIVVKNSREIRISEAQEGEVTVVRDTIRKEVIKETEGVGVYDVNNKDLFFEEDAKTPVIETKTGETLAESNAERSLFFESGWSIAEFKEFKKFRAT